MYLYEKSITFLFFQITKNADSPSGLIGKEEEKINWHDHTLG
jgi:hypothetical protein